MHNLCIKYLCTYHILYHIPYTVYFILYIFDIFRLFHDSWMPISCYILYYYSILVLHDSLRNRLVYTALVFIGVYYLGLFQSALINLYYLTCIIQPVLYNLYYTACVIQPVLYNL